MNEQDQEELNRLFEQALHLMLDRIVVLEDRVEELETRLNEVSASASKGESAYWMQQPLGGNRYLG